MYATGNPKTKRQLFERLAAGRTVEAFQPGGLWPEPWSKASADPAATYTVTLEGPHYPEPHRWYARATVDSSGRIVDVVGLAAYRRKLAAVASGMEPTKRKRNATRADYLSWRYADCPGKATDSPTGIGHELSDRDAHKLASGFGTYRRTLRCAYCRQTLGDYIDAH